MDIDREIAEKVMGWVRVLDGHDDRYAPKDDPNAYAASYDWSPSTNIKHAMAVEAEMFKRGELMEAKHEEHGSWSIIFRSRTQSRVYGIADTLPEAICLAALEAVK